MKHAGLLSVLIVMTFTVLAADFPDIEKLPAKPELPDPLTMLSGEKVTTKEQWFEKRRPELRALFQHYMYGIPPAAPEKIDAKVEREDKNYFNGKATKKQITIRFGPPNTPTLNVLLVIPNQRTQPAPVFVGANFCGNHAVLNDPEIPLPQVWVPRHCAGCVENKATDAGRGKNVDVWNIENSISRGYAVATFYAGDIDPDKNDFTDGVHAAYMKEGETRNNQSWGTIAAWAWGLSRVVDYLVTDKDLDAKKIIAVGHSRLGKTAMLAAAMDDRIAISMPLQAGCGGTAPSRGTVGESVKRINTSFPHWFCGEFKRFNDAPQKLPFDQNCLVALVAPRPVLFANAVEDSWANPGGQFEVLQAADPVYRLLGAGGLDAKTMPENNKLVDSTLGYFIRPGKHEMNLTDWNVFLDFADKHVGKPK
ncbi:MAG TPA: acetylxylan esterase [Planctomycetota bacterium]|nr:acetylxylan esterase [Planctomycetota bacterium]